MTSSSLNRDARRLLGAQALRATAYGFGAVLLGATLEQRGLSSDAVGLVLAAVVAGTALTSVFIGRYGDRIGRRRCYVMLYVALAAVGVVFAFANQVGMLVAIALTGALSTEVVESGPFTSLEQAMLATDLSGQARVRAYGIYNAVASAGGSLGALTAAGLALVNNRPGGAVDERFFLVFVPVALGGAAIAAALTPAVEVQTAQNTKTPTSPPVGLGESRPIVVRLCGLFALDAFGGGFVVQAFVAYWLAVRFGASIGTLGVLFFCVGVLQTVSFLAAPRLAARFGLLRTMVFTHLPSNVLLIAIAAAPNLGVAIALLLARTALSQMDVPTRQAYIMALVTPEERTAAAAYTNTARYVVRPLGPLLAGVTQSIALGLPFVIAGTIKSTYDLVLWRWFAHVELPDDPTTLDASPPAGVATANVEGSELS